MKVHFQITIARLIICFSFGIALNCVLITNENQSNEVKLL